MMTILLTGFEPFLDHKSNPSQQLVEWANANRPALQDLTGAKILTGLLPVSYDRSVKAVESILKSNNVDFILMFGLAANRSCISLEMMAQKHCNSNSPDADQVILKNQTSNTSAKADYLKSIWPLEDWENEMKSLSIPAEVSLDAGGYVCNFLYFNMLQLTKNCLFVHLPQKNDPLILQEAVYFLLKKLSQSIVLSIDP